MGIDQLDGIVPLGNRCGSIDSAWGCPVAAYDNGGIREWLKGNRVDGAGALAKSGDIPGLASAVAKVSGDGISRETVRRLEARDHLHAGVMALFGECGDDVALTARRPQQRRLGVTACCRFDSGKRAPASSGRQSRCRAVLDRTPLPQRYGRILTDVDERFALRRKPVVLHVQRRPLPGYQSIEVLFESIRAGMPAGWNIQVREAPFQSRGMWRRILNCLAMRKLRADVYHVTGDAHYLGFAIAREEDASNDS